MNRKKLDYLTKKNNNKSDQALIRVIFAMLMVFIVLLVIFKPFPASAMTAKSKMRIVGFNYGFVQLVNSEGERFELTSDIDNLKINQLVIVRMILRWDADTNRFQLIDMWIFGERENVFSR